MGMSHLKVILSCRLLLVHCIPSSFVTGWRDCFWNTWDFPQWANEMFCNSHTDSSLCYI